MCISQMSKHIFEFHFHPLASFLWLSRLGHTIGLGRSCVLVFSSLLLPTPCPRALSWGSCSIFKICPRLQACSPVTCPLPDGSRNPCGSMQTYQYKPGQSSKVNSLHAATSAVPLSRITGIDPAHPNREQDWWQATSYKTVEGSWAARGGLGRRAQGVAVMGAGR